MTVLPLLAAILIGYALGNIQAAFILGKLVRNIDIRQHGTTNAGASNATIVLGWKYGILAGLIDILKGALAVVIVRALYPELPGLAFVAGIAAVMGHIYPVLLGFRGGKGIAALVGVLLALNLWLGLAVIASIALLTLLSDYIAVGSIGLYLALPFITWLILQHPPVYVGVAVGLMLVGVYKHLPNVQKIRRGEEVGLRSVMRPET